MMKDNKENNANRKLTKDEEKRLSLFEDRAEQLAREGFAQTELVVSSGKANVTGPLFGLALSAPFALLFYLLRGESLVSGPNMDSLWKYYALFIAAMLLAIPVHELIHGITFCLFTKGKFKSLAFGFNRQALAPYCSCTEALTKGQYLTGMLMPFLLLGVIPCAIAVAVHNLWLLLFGIVMIMSAGGDLMVARLLLGHKTERETIYLDHPTKIGLACFEKSDEQSGIG